jgi:tRNA-uridine 2-sulfurtransferase
MEKKGVLLYSGGLDSLLAARLLMEQNIDLLGVMFILPYFSPDYNPEESSAAGFARSIGLKLYYERCGKEYMEMVKNPPHGYGKAMNPCIDCKIFFLRRAKEIMLQQGASFVATGEVVGQRPMSQMKHMLLHIERESGLKGELLRPLSAKLLKPTRAEELGIVKRDALLSISGRSRFEQARLAEKFNIIEYASPAGGCLFTDANIARRIKQLFIYHSNFNMTDIYLLTIGRHYFLNDRAKIIVGRNEYENKELEKYKFDSDAFIYPEFKGPSIFVRGNIGDEEIKIIEAILGRYGKIDGIGIYHIHAKNLPKNAVISVNPADDNLLQKIRI